MTVMCDRWKSRNYFKTFDDNNNYTSERSTTTTTKLVPDTEFDVA